MLAFIKKYLIKLFLYFEYQSYVTRTEEKKRKLRACGQNVAIRKGVHIGRPENISIGNNVMINRQSMLVGTGGIKIGDGVLIGAQSMILTGEHFGPNFFGNTRYKSVSIGNNVWLGARTTILPGVSIGENVIIAAGAVVTNNVPSNTLYGGIPAKHIRDLEPPN